MTAELQLKIIPRFIANEKYIVQRIADDLKIKSAELSGYQVLRRSIDARQQQIYYLVQVKAFVNETVTERERMVFDYKNVANAEPVIIIGAGPAGLFAALRLIEAGIKPVIFERGKNVKDRRRDLAAINKSGIINPESNYCFGEGGAGTYSDGKLYTRSTKRGNVNRILQVFVNHGADEDILVNTHPHIGTNKLPQIITAMRETILQHGGEIHFNKKLTDLKIEPDNRITATLNNDETITAKALLLATGHSARDIFELLHRKNILIEAKPFALGVRIEHPQQIIDAQQYHCEVRDENLPTASYNLVEQIEGRGVFSFCMCPGGIIAPAATAENEIVVNGWSPSKRNNPFANSGMVVQINETDISNYLKQNNIAASPLSAMYLQQSVEQKSFVAGGGHLKAPAQRMVDFIRNTTSNDLPDCSYLPGLTSQNLSDVLPDFISKSLQKGLHLFGKKMKNYYTNEAVLVATESRTSSPVRIPRDAYTLQHPQAKALYPCGEGAGYAGGIVSAAIDGERCAVAIAKAFE